MGVVDRLEPDHVAVALDGVAAQVEGGKAAGLATAGREPEGISEEEE